MSDRNVRVRLVFADDGNYHAELVSVPAASLERYDRLIDLLREEPSVTRTTYIDFRRLVSASLADQPD